MWLKLFCYVDSFWNSSLKNSSSNPKSNLANSSSNLLYLSCKPKLIETRVWQTRFWIETRVWQTWVLEKVYITKKICPCAIHMKFSFKSTIQPFAVLFTIIQSSQREKKKKEKKKDKKKRRESEKENGVGTPVSFILDIHFSPSFILHVIDVDFLDHWCFAFYANSLFHCIVVCVLDHWCFYHLCQFAIFMKNARDTNDFTVFITTHYMINREWWRLNSGSTSSPLRIHYATNYNKIYEIFLYLYHYLIFILNCFPLY